MESILIGTVKITDIASQVTLETYVPNVVRDAIVIKVIQGNLHYSCGAWKLLRCVFLKFLRSLRICGNLKG
ncbi:hypothetical protein AS038_04225 [Arthrobacter sp. NIO-1057]|nr:hypothetical protein AS038_04225 [Arthrobacter sp. NIO-1057]